VLAESASKADAAATVIANAVNLPGHPGITRVPAREISPDSDLGDLLVTREVGKLTAFEIEEALDSGTHLAASLRERGLIHSAALCLQGQIRVVSSAQEPALLDTATRSLVHA